MNGNRESDVAVLEEFLATPLSSADSVLDRFASLAGAVDRGSGSERFVYVPGIREDRVLLVAHGDTVWDGENPLLDGVPGREGGHGPLLEDGVYRSACPGGRGIGADDRAGCALLWLLRGSGHSLLVTSGEELGRLASRSLVEGPDHSDLAGEIDGSHGFALQLDRRNGGEYKCYDVGTEEFRRYVEGATGYVDAGPGSYTDITVLCRSFPGANLSVGYRHEHTGREILVLRDWLRTLDVCRDWLLPGPLPVFRR